MGQMLEDIQYRLREGSNSLIKGIARSLVGFILGLTISLVCQQMMGYGDLAFFLVILSVVMAFHRITKTWTWTTLTVFSFVCVLIGLLLKLYILVAPGS